MNVYFRDIANNGKLGMIATGKVFDHEDAILAVQEKLVGDGIGYNLPVLAVINGGKK